MSPPVHPCYSLTVMLRTILAILASAVIMFLCGMVSWGFAGWHQPADFKDPAAVAEVLRANTDGHGIYAYPSWRMSDGASPEEAKAEMEERVRQWEEGPFIYATVRPGTRANYSIAGPLFSQFLVVLLGSATLVFLIQKSRHTAFLDRLSIAVLGGVLVGVLTALPPWVFMEQPDRDTLALLIDPIIQLTLAGAAIAVILPRKGSA